MKRLYFVLGLIAAGAVCVSAEDAPCTINYDRMSPSGFTLFYPETEDVFYKVPEKNVVDIYDIDMNYIRTLRADMQSLKANGHGRYSCAIMYHNDTQYNEEEYPEADYYFELNPVRNDVIFSRDFYKNNGKYQYLRAKTAECEPYTKTVNVKYLTGDSGYGYSYDWNAEFTFTEKVAGFDVVSDDDTLEYSLVFPADAAFEVSSFSNSDEYLNGNPMEEMAGRLKLVPEVITFDEGGKKRVYVMMDNCTLIYDINQAATASAEKTIMPSKVVSVEPSLVSRAQNVKVSLPENNGSQTNVRVVSASGVVVYQIQTSEQILSIPACNLPVGINVVQVTTDGSDKRDAAKIIVR